MAYVIVYHKDQEIARKPLAAAAILGRSPDCELSVHDILLSRRHCRIEPDGEGWAIADLGSKNGTRVGGKSVRRASLTDGDVIRMGKTAVRYRTGPFVPGIKPRTPGRARPADPFEALAGTVRDFTYQPVSVATNGIPFPMPRPSPKEPEAYSDEDVRGLVSELVSSSWDSIYQAASRPNEQGSRMSVANDHAIRRARPHHPRVDVSLQAHPDPADPVLPFPSVEDAHPPKLSTIVNPGSMPPPRVGIVIRRLAPLFQWLVVIPLICLK